MRLGLLALSAALWAAPPGATAQTRLELRDFRSAAFTFDTDFEVPGDDLSFSGDGALVPPDAVQLRLRLNRQTIEMIRLGKASYIRSALLGDPNQWYTTGDEDAASYLNIPDDADPMDVFRTVRLLQYDFTPLEPTTLDGTPIDHYQATLRGALLARYRSRLARLHAASSGTAVTPDGLQVKGATVELWVTPDTRYLVKSHTEVEFTLADTSVDDGSPATGQWPPSGRRPPAPANQAAGGKSLSYEQTFHFDDLDAPMSITAPADALPLPR